MESVCEVGNGGEGPLALALSGGGARAAYQVGVLAAIAERVDKSFEFPVVTGVSAGSINAATLAASPGTFQEAVAGLEREWLNLSLNDVFAADFPSLLKGTLKLGATLIGAGKAPGLQLRGLLDTGPLRQTLSRSISTKAIERKLRTGRLKALGLSTTRYDTGRTVTFVHAPPGVDPWRRVGRIAVRTPITVDHVLASSALPIVFPAIRIDEAWYGDGSIRQLAPLAPAVHLGAGRILAVSLRHGPGEITHDSGAYPPPAHTLGMILNAVFLDAMEADAERLLRVNRSLEQFAPGVRHSEGLRPIRLHLLRPSRDLGALARGLGGYLPSGLRFLLRGLGSNALESPHLLSYLLFERPYTERLIELGRADAAASWPALETFFEEYSAV